MMQTYLQNGRHAGSRDPSLSWLALSPSEPGELIPADLATLSSELP